MAWTNILVPVLGASGDAQSLSVAKALAAPFDATLSVVFAAPSPSSLFNWVMEGGVSVTDVAITAIEEETARARIRCRDLLADLDYPQTMFEQVTTDDWLGLRSATRLADVVIWDRSAAGAMASLLAHSSRFCLTNAGSPSSLTNHLSWVGRSRSHGTADGKPRAPCGVRFRCSNRPIV